MSATQQTGTGVVSLANSIDRCVAAGPDELRCAEQAECHASVALVQALDRLTAALEDLPNQLATLGTREAHVSVAMKTSRLLTAADVAALFSCDQRTLRRLVRAGSAPKPIHLGSLKRWRLGDIESWLEKKR